MFSEWMNTGPNSCKMDQTSNWFLNAKYRIHLYGNQIIEAIKVKQTDEEQQKLG